MGGDWYSIECGSMGQDGKDSPGGGGGGEATSHTFS